MALLAISYLRTYMAVELPDGAELAGHAEIKLSVSLSVRSGS